MITFGRCKRCGSSGADYPEASLSSADSTSDLDTTGNGVKLEKFRGVWLCPMCIKQIKQEEESIAHSKKFNATKAFLAKAGFRNSVT